MALSSAFAPTVVDTANLQDTTFTPALLDYYKIYFWRVRPHECPRGRGMVAVFPVPHSAGDGVERQRLRAAGGIRVEPELSESVQSDDHIQIAVPSAGRVVVNVFDVLGREETTLVDAEMPAGTYTVTFDASPSGKRDVLLPDASG